jgi:hypothetical protein
MQLYILEEILRTYYTSTEGYDGASWSSKTSLATGRAYIAGFGSASSGVAAAELTCTQVQPKNLLAKQQH